MLCPDRPTLRYCARASLHASRHYANRRRCANRRRANRRRPMPATAAGVPATVVPATAGETAASNSVVAIPSAVLCIIASLDYAHVSNA